MIPAHDRLLGPVPAHIVDRARAITTPYDGRVVEYNIAAWLQLPGLANLPVSLLVNYQDGEHAREVAVEHGKVGAQGKVLLSGIARLPLKHKIQAVRVMLRSAIPAQGLVVEELFVQAVEPPASDKRQVRA